MIQCKNVLGPSNGNTWNKENQKRELPHTHNLYWIKDFQVITLTTLIIIINYSSVIEDSIRGKGS